MLRRLWRSPLCCGTRPLARCPSLIPKYNPTRRAMSSSSPSAMNNPIPGEEFELASSHQSQSRDPPPPKLSRGHSRTLTLHPNQSSAVLFAAPGGSTVPSPRRVRRRNSSNPVPQSPELGTTSRRYSQAQFLHEDLDHLGPDTEEVQVPDFGHILGFETGEDHYAIAQAMKTKWKRRLYLLLEEPSSGREAFFVHVVVTGTILFSAILTTLSTLPSFHTNPLSIQTLFGLDTFIVVLFTIEYLARSIAHSDTWSQYYNWSTSFFAILDLLSILPYYVEVAKQEDTSILFRFSILRTFRLLRVFRAFKYQNQMLLTIEVMYVAVRRSKDALVAISFFILLVLVLFSTLIYFAERGIWDANLGAFVDADGNVSLFDSIPQTAWFALVTMSTVGYGDVVPKSALGKVLSVPLLMFGLLLIALPSFVLGRNFAIVFDAMISHANKTSSNLNSPRESIDESRTVTLPTVHEHANTPLLPVSAPPPAPSPNPEASGSRAPPRMWDGETSNNTNNIERTAARERDLTNIKLAKNQLVLLEQIDSLRLTIDRQGEMLSLLMAALDVKDSGKLIKNEKRKQPSQLDEDHFSLGDTDDEEVS